MFLLKKQSSLLLTSDLDPLLAKDVQDKIDVPLYDFNLSDTSITQQLLSQTILEGVVTAPN